MAKEIYASRAASDLSAAAAQVEAIKAPFAGVLRIDECYMRAGEVVGAATTPAVVYVSVAGTTVATATPSPTTLDTIGDTQTLIASDQKYIEFDAGDVIAVGHSTAAAGGTTTGTTYFHLSIEWGV